MYLKNQIILATAFVLALGAATAAQADVTISSDVTQNMTCSGGICAPTASDAVLNVGDLETLLGAGNVTVTTTASGVQANNVDVTTEFDWSSASGLTLDAYQSITFTAPVTDGSTGGVSLITNDGGSGGALSFLPAGSLSFTDPKAALSVNGRKYRLEQTLKRLINDIVAKPNGAFALANNFDARRERAYSASPISIPFGGSLIGLGNTISSFEIEDQSNDYVGLFASLSASGILSGVRLVNVVVRAGGSQSTVGALVGLNLGTVVNSSSGGEVEGVAEGGGLVGSNEGTISRSSSTATVNGNNDLGGLVGANDEGAIIVESFATGRVKSVPPGEDPYDGGLIGANFGQVANSYATGNIKDSAGTVGGLIGFINEQIGGAVANSYSTGAPNGGSVGGFLGFDYLDAGTISNCYWDTTTSKTTRGVGNGIDAGITGLTTQQMQNGLPAGFDPTVWGENANINNGLPYLLANPPL